MASNSQAVFLHTSPIRPSTSGCSQPQKMLGFRVKLSENCTTLCQSDGRETIIDMVKTALDKKQMKKNLEYMMFKSSKGFFLNLGKPTGALSQDDEYECIFKEKLKEKTVDSIRDYCVQDFEKEWNLKSFYLKLSQNRKSQPPIGNITRIADVIQVDFFPEETLFEALGRDNRLKVSSEDELLLRKWYLKMDDNTEVPLRNKAESCEGRYFELYKNKNPDTDLLEYVLPLRQPTQVCSNSTSSKVDVTSGSVQTTNLLSVTPVKDGKVGRRGEIIDNSVSYTKRTYKMSSGADLEDFIKCKLRFKIQKQEDNKAEKERNTIIKKFFKTNYDSFASRCKFHMDLDEINALSDAVGAVIAEVVNNTEVFIATCFRIGSEYVITTRHSINECYEQEGLKNLYVNFSSKGDVSRYKAVMKPVCSSTELDYVILKLAHNNAEKLPGNLTSHGYCIPPLNQLAEPGNLFTLIGYHGSANKAVHVYITCPIANPGNLDKNVVLSLSRRNIECVAVNNNGVQAVDNGTLSASWLSGSPCLLRNEKLLMGLYCRGFHLQDCGDSVVEQAVLMSAVVEDVRQKIGKGVLPMSVTIKDIFDIVDGIPRGTL